MSTDTFTFATYGISFAIGLVMITWGFTGLLYGDTILYSLFCIFIGSVIVYTVLMLGIQKAVRNDSE
uniref:hypothetical protein n=1 Tax=Halorhabdus salina TaxID=2750670 RepID=UPI001C67BF46